MHKIVSSELNPPTTTENKANKQRVKHFWLYMQNDTHYPDENLLMQKQQ